MAQKIEDMISEIETVIKDLESGDVSLDDSIKQYEQGMKLINSCMDKLNKAEKSIKLIEKNADGKLEEVDFEDHKKDDGSETVKDFKAKVDNSKKVKKKTVKEEDLQDDLGLF